jgi:3-dehydroquinate dehydratase-2
VRILVLQGPNLDRIGLREPEIYGRATLADVTRALDALAAELGVGLDHFQSAHEGALIDRVWAAKDAGAAGAIVNAGGYTHTSVALRDALVGAALPFVEVHLSNVWRREAYRHESLLSDVARGVVVGLGPVGYELALRGLVAHLR